MLTGLKQTDIEILKRMDDKDLVSYCKTNKAAKAVCDDQDFWKYKVFNGFDYVPSEVLARGKGVRKWSDYYIKLIKIGPKDLGSGIRYDKLDVVMVAIKKGANVNGRILDEFQMPNRPLPYAASLGHLNIVKFLVENGADIHYNNDSPLTEAVNSGHLDTVKYLVGQGANIRVGNDYALSKASSDGNLEMVKYLVQNGADIHADNDFAVRIAHNNKRQKVVDYLVSQGSRDPRN